MQVYSPSTHTSGHLDQSRRSPKQLLSFYERSNKVTAARAMNRRFSSQGIKDGQNASIRTGIGEKSKAKSIAH